MDKFLNMYDLPNLNQEDINNLNRSIMINEIENLPRKKSPDSDEFTDELYQTFKEVLTPMYLKIFQKYKGKDVLPNSLYEAYITLVPKPISLNTEEKFSIKYL
jgi:hypothetical protein